MKTYTEFIEWLRGNKILNKVFLNVHKHRTVSVEFLYKKYGINFFCFGIYESDSNEYDFWHTYIDNYHNWYQI